MRITALLIVEIVLTVVLAICCLYVWASGSRQREIGSAWRQARKYQIQGEPNKGEALEAVERLLEISPDLPEVRFQLAGTYLEAKNIKDAVRHYKVIAEAKDTRSPGGKAVLKKLQALTEVYLGMIDGRDGAKLTDLKRRKTKFDSARKHFLKAIELEYPQGLKPEALISAEVAASILMNPEAQALAERPTLVAYGDACAGLGLLALWAGDWKEAEKQFLQALSGKSELGANVLREVCNGLGLALAGQNRAGVAMRMFDCAKYYDKKWNVPDRNKELVRQSTAGSADMDPKTRQVYLTQIEKSIAKHKKPSPDTLNLLGCGYYHIGNMQKAHEYLSKAYKAKPDSRPFLFNLLAVRWELFAKYRKEFGALREKFFPAPKGDPQERYWTVPLALQNPKRSYSREQLANYYRAAHYFHKAEADFESISATVLANAADLDPATEKTLILARLEMVPAYAARLKVSKGAGDRKRGADLLTGQAKTLEAGLKKFPEEPRLIRLKGMEFLGEAKYKEALALFEKVKASGADLPGLKEVEAVFAQPPSVVGFRPLPSPASGGGEVLARSATPLLGVAFRVNTGPVPLNPEKVKVLVDGREVQGAFWGSEFLFIPGTGLADGSHTLKAAAEDMMGRKASGEFSFLVDDSPPEIYKTEPADGGVIAGPRPKLVIYFRDKYSGVDPSSVEVELRSDRGASTWLVETPVRGGRYTYTHQRLGIVKDAAVGADQVVISPGRALGAGTYKVTVQVQDVRGLLSKKTWRFKVRAQ
ncbi:MAG: tetratricopeptide repeat protein [Planctomycetota bacterium]|jgi:tetratricopeptide (TPR) repeat protein